MYVCKCVPHLEAGDVGAIYMDFGWYRGSLQKEEFILQRLNYDKKTYDKSKYETCKVVSIYV